ncbi:unnamed protein product, partial [Symbiodinium pilosum]
NAADLEEFAGGRSCLVLLKACSLMGENFGSGPRTTKRSLDSTNGRKVKQQILLIILEVGESGGCDYKDISSKRFDAGNSCDIRFETARGFTPSSLRQSHEVSLARGAADHCQKAVISRHAPGLYVEVQQLVCENALMVPGHHVSRSRWS